ncbi:spermine/spermidine synthase domain-containing protein [Aquicella lusitana]|uniref:Polyamine aminopropyltransferase n=1 Tax=Aquicella lusitana TaxID=254246 RepID=A0A370G3F3_9COXI|nr:hypothetical protein [Aquicella lusitana]RDI38368.1 spermidine synthase [Aquicella lusitana]VVC72381.1 Polyamine aminopropyltransferase [Aquicella lusitana]
MPKQLLKNFAIEIQEKLDEKETPQGKIAVYQTVPFGKILSLNGKIIMSEHDGFFYHEMLAHPALFTHAYPETVAIIGSSFGTCQEVIKHSAISTIDCIDNQITLQKMLRHYFAEVYPETKDTRIQSYDLDTNQWLSQCESDRFDLIIQTSSTETAVHEDLCHYFRILKCDGLIVQPCVASLLQPQSLKLWQQSLQNAGFAHCQFLSFPQPSYPGGWRTVALAAKRPGIYRMREKRIYNRTFATRYYNFDVHKAAMALPEFMREEPDLFQ